ncbi:hypothetical protein OUO20_06060 [Arthrobacter sp. FX8]|nr:MULTISPECIES: hypothetical protein [unclassified Arthrobacter]WAJ34486.1 hypothetical protein OUO20_06060 [Arthrobacter sp. FX8]
MNSRPAGDAVRGSSTQVFMRSTSLQSVVEDVRDDALPLLLTALS